MTTQQEVELKEERLDIVAEFRRISVTALKMPKAIRQPVFDRRRAINTRIGEIDQLLGDINGRGSDKIYT